MNYELISVVVPVYNVEPYLPDCLDSILAQDYPRFECILVNDGSTDRSGDICDEYARRDIRFRVFHQQNAGVSAARNKGIAEARGEFITFIDSDDWVDSSYLSSLINASADADLIVSGYKIHHPDKINDLKPTKEDRFCLDEKHIPKIVELLVNYTFYGPYCKLFRSNILKQKQLKFPEHLTFGEDLCFNFEYLRHITTIASVPESHYHYRIGTNTLSTKFYPDKWDMDYSQWQLMREVFTERNLFKDGVKEYMYHRLFTIIEWDIFDTINSRETKKWKSSKIYQILSIDEIHNKDFRKVANKINTSSWWITESIKRGISLPFKLLITLK